MKLLGIITTKKSLITVMILFLFSIASMVELSTLNVLAGAPATCPTGYTCTGGCTAPGQCSTNRTKCVLGGYGGYGYIAPGTEPCGSYVVGGVDPPKGVARYNFGAAMSNGGTIGILLFISNALKFFAVICGLLVFFNILYAGYEYIVGAGKTDVHVKVRERLTWSVVGLILLIAAYMIAALIGLLIFGDPTFLLNPDLTKYGALAP